MYKDNSMQSAMRKKDFIARQKLKIEQEIAKYEKRQDLEAMMVRNLQFSQNDIDKLSFKTNFQVVHAISDKYNKQIN